MYQSKIANSLKENKTSIYNNETIWSRIKDTMTDIWQILSRTINNSGNRYYKNQQKKIYKDARNILNNTIRWQKRLAEKKAIDNIEKYKYNHRIFFKQIKSIKEGYKVQNYIMTDNEGNLLTETVYIKDISRIIQENTKWQMCRW